RHSGSTRRPPRPLATGVPLSIHSATLSADEADTWAVLVSYLSARDPACDRLDHPVLAPTVVDLVDHFAVLDDPRHQPWVEHPLAAVLVLCAAAVVAGMRVHRDRRVGR